MAFLTLLSSIRTFWGIFPLLFILSHPFALAEPTQSAKVMLESLGAQIKIVSDELIATGRMEDANQKLLVLQKWIEKPEIVRDFKNATDLTLHAKMKRELHILTQLIQVTSQLTPEKLEEMLVQRRYDRAQIRDLYSAAKRGEIPNSDFDQNVLRKKSWIDRESDKERIRNIRWEVSEQILSQIGNLMMSSPLYLESYEVISWAINLTMEHLIEVFPPTVVHLALDHQMIDVLVNFYQKQISPENMGPETKRMLQNLSQVQARHPLIQLQIRALFKNASRPLESIAPDEKDLNLYKRSIKALIFKEDPQQSNRFMPYYFIPGQYMYLSEWIHIERELRVIEEWLQHHGQETQTWRPQLGTSPEGVEFYQNKILQSQNWPCLQLLSPMH